MKLVNLGETELVVSSVGLGTGGPSALGRSRGLSPADSVRLIHMALDAGVNLLDTSPVYETEDLVGVAVSSWRRNNVVLSSKVLIRVGDNLIGPDELHAQLERSLQLLEREWIDIYSLHGVHPSDYELARRVLMPEMAELKREGKIRAIGVSEIYSVDTEHHMLESVVRDRAADVVMMGYNLVHQSGADLARRAMAAGIGVLGLCPVRQTLADPEAFNAMVGQLGSEGVVDLNLDQLVDPTKWLLEITGCDDLAEVAYRFAFNARFIHSTLFGTGRADHLIDNLRYAETPPLASRAADTITKAFKRVGIVDGRCQTWVGASWTGC